MSSTIATADTDILIVGAGPTGLTLANLLGGMGIDTTLVERNDGTVTEPRAVSIDDESMRAMQAAGLVDEVQAITARGYGSIYKGPDGRPFARVMPLSTDYGFDKRNAFQQPDFEAVLREGLKRHASVTALFRTEITGFTQRPERVEATIVAEDGASRRLTARYLAACDGGRSPSRKRLGIELRGGTFAEPWLIVDLVKTVNRGRHTEVFCDPDRSCISLPGPDGIRRYEFLLRADEDEAAALEEPFVRRLLARVGPDEHAPLKRVRVYTFHARLAEHWRRERIFLAGDAAHLTPPFAGQGMNSGLRDAHNLAWKLAEALHSATPDALLDSYQTEREPHAQSMIDMALRMGQVMMPTSPMQGRLVRSAFRMLGLYPPARDYFVQMRYKPKPRFAKGLVWSDSANTRHTIVGRMLPQPIVETTERRRLLLDDVLPDRAVLLIFAERPEESLAAELLDEFRRAGAAVVGLTPEGINPCAADFTIVRDASRLFSAEPYLRHLEHAILLRRDRYVASARPVAHARELLAHLAVIAPPGKGVAMAEVA